MHLPIVDSTPAPLFCRPPAQDADVVAATTPLLRPAAYASATDVFSENAATRARDSGAPDAYAANTDTRTWAQTGQLSEH